jgi:hypothetical protein
MEEGEIEELDAAFGTNPAPGKFVERPSVNSTIRLPATEGGPISKP